MWQNCSPSATQFRRPKSSRSQKARTLASGSTDVVLLQGAGGADNLPVVMSNLIWAEDLALVEAGRGVP